MFVRVSLILLVKVKRSQSRMLCMLNALQLSKIHWSNWNLHRCSLLKLTLATTWWMHWWIVELVSTLSALL